MTIFYNKALVPILFIACICPFCWCTPSPVVIGSEKQLFIDSELVSKINNVVFTVNQPDKGGIVFPADRPWESLGIAGASVIQDGSFIRMYYRAVMLKDGGGRGQAYTCYAQSTDGIHWDKPDCNQVEFQGSKHNNIFTTIP